MTARHDEHPGFLVQPGGEHLVGGQRQRGPPDQGVDVLVGQRAHVAAAQVPGGDLGAGVLGPVAGRTAVLDFVRAGHAAQTGRVRHHLSNVVVTTADADRAEARAYLLQTRNTSENVQVISTGVYTFGLRRSARGWRIAELTLALDNAL